VLELLPRIIGSVFFSAYAGYVVWLQTREFLRGPVPVDDVLARAFVVVAFSLMALTYWLRGSARVKAVGFRERIFPFLCAVLPIAVNELGGPSALGARKWIATGLLFFGDVIVISSLISLRRCFSIMAEVRMLVASGPFRFVRHPIYVGQVLATGGLLMLAPSWPSAGLFLAFVVLQHARAVIEEKKLMASLPEYRAYRERTGMYVPIPRGRLNP
jgi:protein-S-isoprenylcysteine O-methyltransferase Ste14